MRAVDIIIKKRDGGELSKEEIDYFSQGFARDGRDAAFRALSADLNMDMASNTYLQHLAGWWHPRRPAPFPRRPRPAP